jgi:hypothetical protein
MTQRPDPGEPLAATPAVVHTRLTPVFVVGHGRSGTTLLVRLLSRFLGIGFGTESQFILRYLRRLPRYGDLAKPGALRRLLDDVARERFFERTRSNFGFVLDRERLLRDIRTPTFAALVAGIFTQLAEHLGTPRWGDKTPEYSADLPSISRLFPDAQFVHVVRDGRDVALSAFHTHFGAKNACMGAFEWKQSVEAIRRFRQKMPATQFHELRYEDLMQSPERTFEPLIGFLGIDDAAGTVAARVRAELGGALQQDNVDKWKRGLAARDIERFEGVAGETLDYYGYERRHPEAAYPGPLRRAFWMLDDRVRRYGMPAYWQDNWYKLGLRIRAIHGLVRFR